MGFTAALALCATPTLANLTQVDSDAEAYAVCSSYLMADLHYFEHHNDGGDMDMAFEDAVTSFVIAAIETQWSWDAQEIDILRYKDELVSLMLVIFLMMEEQATNATASSELAALRSFCAKLGAKHEETRWVFQ